MDDKVAVQKVACACCGASISVPNDIEQLKCAYCGSNLVIRRGDGFAASKLEEQVTNAVRQVGAEIGNRLDSIQSALDIDAGIKPVKCLLCGRADALQKVTAIMDAANARAKSKTPDAQNAQLAASLALRLRKPSKKARHSDPVMPNHVLGAARIVLGLALIVSVFALRNGVAILAAGVVGVGLVIVGIARWRGRPVEVAERNLQRWQSRVSQYQAAQQRYDRAYYCSRCAAVVVSGESVSIPLRQWRASLSSVQPTVEKPKPVS